MSKLIQSRRQFLINSGKVALGVASANILSACHTGESAPAIIVPDNLRPKLPSGIQIGDVSNGNATIWARADRTAKLRVEYSFNESFKQSKLAVGKVVTNASDFTGRVELTGLPQGQDVFLRVTFEDASNNNAISEPYAGHFRTMPANDKTPIRFVWGGDVNGQGWGINPEIGGMKIWETMRQRKPDFFIHSGDAIYADGAIKESVTIQPVNSLKPDEVRIWKNIVTEEVSKPAETLKEYRGRHRYNFMDENLRRFAAEVPQIWQWDDHDVLNNWSPSTVLANRTDGSVHYSATADLQTLVAYGRQAFLENSPMQWRTEAIEDQRIYRKINYGPLLDVFVLDERSYRGPNSTNVQTTLDNNSAFLGKEQVDWLVNELTNSKAVWKVIASDMPLSLNVEDHTTGNANWFEAIANENDGAPLGRELEIAGLLSATKAVKNTVWITADVHYCAAHYYDNNKAKFTDFKPFWEFVAGPLNAGTFGPNTLDKTFGPQLIFQKTPPAGKSNLSPLDGYQFFGEVNIDPASKVLTVDFRDLAGAVQFTQAVEPDLSYTS